MEPKTNLTEYDILFLKAALARILDWGINFENEDFRLQVKTDTLMCMDKIQCGIFDFTHNERLILYVSLSSLKNNLIHNPNDPIDLLIEGDGFFNSRDQLISIAGKLLEMFSVQG